MGCLGTGSAGGGEVGMGPAAEDGAGFFSSALGVGGAASVAAAAFGGGAPPVGKIHSTLSRNNQSN